MRSYEAARSLFGFLAFVAWLVVVVGGLVALVSAGSVSRYAGGGAGLLAMSPGIGIAIAGLILVAFVQMGRATVDTAEYTQQMLKIARDQLDVSKQGLKQARTAKQSYSEASSTPDASPRSTKMSETAKPAPQEKAQDFSTYRGHKIYRVGASYKAVGAVFASREEAVDAIDHKLAAPQVGPAKKEPAPAAAQTAKPTLSEKPATAEKRIHEEGGKFYFGNMVFASKETAEKYVGRLGVNPNFKPD